MTTYQPALVRELHGGKQRVYRFANGYGASVVKHWFSRGTELAVIAWDDPDDGVTKFEIDYNTPVLDDDDDGIAGYLDEVDVQRLLAIIEELPPRYYYEEEGDEEQHD